MTPTVGEAKRRPQPEAKGNPTAARQSAVGGAGAGGCALQRAAVRRAAAGGGASPEKRDLPWSGGGTKAPAAAVLAFLGTDGSR